MNWNDLTPRACELALAAWLACDGRVEAFEKNFGRVRRQVDADAIAAASNARLWLPCDDEFPVRVRERLQTPLPWLVRGDLPPGPRLGVVGSRAVDHEGIRICRRIVGEVAAAGVVVVSGGAIGVDTHAHEAALAAGAPTVAILPSAFDRPTPTRNAPLFAQIAEHGMLVTEYPAGVGAHRFHFHRRNELIAAFSHAVLVVRAKEKGGTMITARAAVRQHTPLLAVPGSPEDETAAGCNLLLREGATCVTSGAHVLEELGIATEFERPRQLTFAVSAAARDVLSVLETPRDLDEICAASGLSPSAALVAITELEISHAVTCRGGRWSTK